MGRRGTYRGMKRCTGRGTCNGNCLPILIVMDDWKLTWSPHGEPQSSHIAVAKTITFFLIIYSFALYIPFGLYLTPEGDAARHMRRPAVLEYI